MYFTPTVTITLQVFGELQFGEQEVLAALEERLWWGYANDEKKTATSVRYLAEKSGRQGDGTSNRNFGIDHVFEASYDSIRLCDRFGQTKAFRKFVQNLANSDGLHRLPGVVLISLALRLENEPTSVGTRTREQLYRVYKYLQSQAA